MALRKLQLVQNWAAKLVLQKKKYSSSTNALMSLHWLPIEYRIQYKILCLVHNCLKGKVHKYLQELLQFHSTKLKIYVIVFYVNRENFANRSFSVAGPRLWNGLPNDLRTEFNFDNFRSKLKTFLFQ